MGFAINMYVAHTLRPKGGDKNYGDH